MYKITGIDICLCTYTVHFSFPFLCICLSRLWQAFGTSGANVTTVLNTLLLSAGKDMQVNDRSDNSNGNSKTAWHIIIPGAELADTAVPRGKAGEGF